MRGTVASSWIRWVVGLLICLGAVPGIGVGMWLGDQDEQRFARDAEILTVRVEDARRTSPGKYMIVYVATTTIRGREYEFPLGSTRPYEGTEVRVAFDGERVVPLSQVPSDREAFTAAVVVTFAFLALVGWWSLGRNLVPLRGLLDTRRRLDDPGVAVTVVGWRRPRHPRGEVRNVLRVLAFRGVHQLDLDTADGRRLRWVGQHRFEVWDDSFINEFEDDYTPVGMTGMLVGGAAPGQWAFLVMEEKRVSRMRVLPPSAPLTSRWSSNATPAGDDQDERRDAQQEGGQ